MIAFYLLVAVGMLSWGTTLILDPDVYFRVRGAAPPEGRSHTNIYVHALLFAAGGAIVALHWWRRGLLLKPLAFRERHSLRQGEAVTFETADQCNRLNLDLRFLTECVERDPGIRVTVVDGSSNSVGHFGLNRLSNPQRMVLYTDDVAKAIRPLLVRITADCQTSVDVEISIFERGYIPRTRLEKTRRQRSHDKRRK